MAGMDLAASRSVVSGIARGAVRAARAQGVDEHALLAEVGLSAEALKDPTARISVAANRRLWESAAALCGRPDIGLGVGTRVSPGFYGVVGLLAASCATVGEALEDVQRFYPLLSNGARFSLVYAAETVTMSIVPLPEVGPFPRALADSVISTYLAAIRHFSGETITPIHARLQLRRPQQCAVYDEVVGAEVRFGQADNALVFDREILAAPVRSAQRELCLILRTVAERTEILACDSLVARLEGWAREQLDEGSLGRSSLPSAARHLGVSTRTLQRKLAEQRLSYREVMAGVAMRRARELLEQPSLSVQEVASRLGFDDLRAFSRAFRRHTSQSPSAYRRSH